MANSDKKEMARAIAVAQDTANKQGAALYVWLDKKESEYVVLDVPGTRTIPGYVFIRGVQPSGGAWAWWHAIRARFRNRNATQETASDGEASSEERFEPYRY